MNDSALHVHRQARGSARLRVHEVVVITGASAGIGRATALAFARKGSAVALLSRNAARLRTAREEIEALGGTALDIPIDVADAAQVEAAADRIERELGPIDVWVNNATASVFARIGDITAAEFRRVTEVTYLGTVYGTMAALRRMRGRNDGHGRGVIVQVGSALAYRSIPLQSAYCGAKAAVRGFTDSLRTELLHEGSQVRLSMVQLSAFNTPQFDWSRSHLPNRLQPVPPIFQPEIAARAIVRAALEAPRERWVGWPAAKAILFTRIAPASGDRLAAEKAYDAQQTSEPAPPDRPDNLFETVDGPLAAHGRFDDVAHSASIQIWISEHRVLAIAAALVAIAVLLAGWWL